MASVSARRLDLVQRCGVFSLRSIHSEASVVRRTKCPRTSLGPLQTAWGPRSTTNRHHSHFPQSLRMPLQAQLRWKKRENGWAQRRKASSEYRDPEEKLSRLFRTKSSIKKQQDTTLWQYSQAELDPALQDAFDQSLSAARYASLLRLGAKPKFKESLRAATTESASGTTRSASGIVLLLLHRDQKLAKRKQVLSRSLNDALSEWTVRHEASLDSDRLIILKALLACGANATADHLDQAVKASRPDIAELLLRAVAPPPTTSVSGNLRRAVRLGDYDTLSVLLAYEGDPGTDNAQCLLTAITSRALRFAAALLANHSGSLGAAQLTTCLEAVLSGIPPGEQLSWLQLFFAAEARGVPRTLAQRLLRAIRRQR